MNCDFPDNPNDDGKFVCQRCEFTYHKRVKVNCPAGKTITAPRPRGDKRTIATDELKQSHKRVADTARPWPKILATLDRCFGGCKKMDERVGHCILRGKSCTCRKRWIEYILFNECDYEPR